MDSFPIEPEAWTVVIPGWLHRDLHAHLFPGDGDEHAAVIAAGISRTDDGRVRLLARDLFLAIDGIDHVPSQRGYRKTIPEFVRDKITYCRNEGLVYLSIHNHAGSDEVSFSKEDFASHERGYPALRDIASGLPVGALVFAENAVAGDIWLPDGNRVKLDKAISVDSSRHVLRSHPVVENNLSHAAFDRQVRIFGEKGQRLLREASVAIIGLGGVGSLVAEYLGHLGVGRILLMDPDRIEDSNLSRVVGSRPADVTPWVGFFRRLNWMRSRAKHWARFKVDIAKRLIRRINSAANVAVSRSDFTLATEASAVLSCDFIFLAADSMSARLLFNAIVHQHYIPGIQIGSKVHVDEAGNVASVFSVVRHVNPGEGCLWCNELIDPAKLQDEAVGANERHAQRYVDEPDIPAPSVITLNAVGAAHAVNDFLFYFTDLAKPGAPAYWRHMALDRQCIYTEPRKDPWCTECGHHRESRLGRGSSRTLPTRQTKLTGE